MKLIRFLLYALFVAAITVGVVLLLYQVSRPEFPPGTVTLPYQFSVAQYPGVDAGTDIFRLGAVTPESSSKRSLSITDPYAGVVNETGGAAKRVQIIAVGEGSEWLRLEPTEVMVPAVVEVTLAVPQGARLGVYKGALVVIPVSVE